MMDKIDFMKQAEKMLCEVKEEEYSDEYSVLGYKDGFVDLIPSNMGFVVDNVQFFWDGYGKNNCFDTRIETIGFE